MLINNVMLMEQKGQDCEDTLELTCKVQRLVACFYLMTK